jgi:hypothetical protein
MEELRELCVIQAMCPNKAADRELELINKYGKTVKGLKK